MKSLFICCCVPRVTLMQPSSRASELLGHTLADGIDQLDALLQAYKENIGKKKRPLIRRLSGTRGKYTLYIEPSAIMTCRCLAMPTQRTELILMRGWKNLFMYQLNRLNFNVHLAVIHYPCPLMLQEAAATAEWRIPESAKSVKIFEVEPFI